MYFSLMFHCFFIFFILIMLVFFCGCWHGEVTCWPPIAHDYCLIFFQSLLSLYKHDDRNALHFLSCLCFENEAYSNITHSKQWRTEIMKQIINEINQALGHLCAHRLNWARRTSWGWWDDWDDTVLQTQDSKFEPWRSEASTLPLGHGGSPQYWLSHADGEETFLCLSTAETGNRTPNSGVKGTTLGPPP